MWGKVGGLLVLLAATALYQLVDDGRAVDITVVDTSARLDAVLDGHREVLGADYERYRNHCLRVLSYSLWFLARDGVEATAEQREAMETALAWHDLGLWTDGQLNYLAPSAARAPDSALVRDIIMEHHKITAFSSAHGTAHDAIVNAVRKADWADASLGLVHSGLSRANIRAVDAALPNLGFHAMLAEFPVRLRGWSGLPGGLWDLLHIFRW